MSDAGEEPASPPDEVGPTEATEAPEATEGAPEEDPTKEETPTEEVTPGDDAASPPEGTTEEAETTNTPAEEEAVQNTEEADETVAEDGEPPQEATPTVEVFAKPEPIEKFCSLFKALCEGHEEISVDHIAAFFADHIEEKEELLAVFEDGVDEAAFQRCLEKAPEDAVLAASEVFMTKRFEILFESILEGGGTPLAFVTFLCNTFDVPMDEENLTASALTVYKAYPGNAHSFGEVMEVFLQKNSEVEAEDLPEPMQTPEEKAPETEVVSPVEPPLAMVDSPTDLPSMPFAPQLSRAASIRMDPVVPVSPGYQTQTPIDGFDDGFEDCGEDDDLMEYEDMDIGHRLYYTGCETERRKQVYLQRERECKIMNELAYLSDPKITAKARLQPSRTDEFRSVTRVEIFNKGIEIERKKKQVQEEKQFKSEMKTTHLSSNSKRIIETTLSSRYKSPVAQWEVHRERHEKQKVVPVVDRAAFSPNINRTTPYLAQRGKGPVFDRLHSDAATKRASKVHPEATPPKRASSTHPSVTPPGLPTGMADGTPEGSSSIIFRKSQSPATESYDEPSPSPTGYALLAEKHEKLTREEQAAAAAAAVAASAGNDVVINRLLSAGQEKVRKRERLHYERIAREAHHPFSPILNERSVELAAERRKKEVERRLQQHRLLEEQQTLSDLTPATTTTTPNKKPPGTKRTADFQTRTKQETDKRREKQRQMAALRQTQEMDGCTFQPMICRNSDALFRVRSGDTLSHSTPPSARTPSPSSSHAMTSGPRTMLSHSPSYRAYSPPPSAQRSDPRTPLRGEPQMSDASVPAARLGSGQTVSEWRGSEGREVREAKEGGLKQTTPLRPAASEHMSPFDRKAPSKELQISTHSIEKEINAVLDEWNRIQCL